MTLIIEPNTDSDYQLFVQLAKRLNVKFRRAETEEEQREAHFFSLAGSLDTPETGNELLAIIETGKDTKDQDFTF
jgi:hypothetical protein